MTGQSAAFAAIFAVGVLLAGPAEAGDAGHAWGTISNPGQGLLNSAATHVQQGTTAGIIDRGAGSSTGGTSSSGFPAVTSCGTCTTITIQGNNNSISGTSITSSNTGVVTSTGTFNGQ